MLRATERLDLPLPKLTRQNAWALTPVRLAGVGVLLSCLYSALRLWADPLFNPDAVFYLVAAEAWIENGVGGAMDIYWRPFYSILIGSLAMASGLSTVASAHVLDALMGAGLLVAMQLLIRELGGDLRTQAIGVALVLLLPSLNAFRVLIIRDFGYWTACVLGLVAMSRYAHTGRVAAAAWFYAAVLVAMLFRPEAVVLLLLPAVLLLGRERRRGLRDLAVALVPLACAGSLLMLGAVLSERVAGFVAGVLHESLREPLRLIDMLPQRFASMYAAFSSEVLNVDFHDYAVVGLIVGVVAIVFSHLLAAISWPVVTVCALGLRRRVLATLDREALRVSLASVAIVVTMLCVFLVIRPIMQTRFLMLPALIVVALAPFAVIHLGRRAVVHGRQVAFRWGMGVLVAYLVGEAGFSMIHSKAYVLDAVRMVQSATPADARLLSNDPRITYLSGRRYDWQDLLEALSLQHLSARRLKVLERRYPYWAVHLEAGAPGTPELERQVAGWPEIGRTANRDGDQIVIVAVPGGPGS